MPSIQSPNTSHPHSFSLARAGNQSPPPSNSDPVVEVRLLIQTTSAKAQQQLDRLQRAASNNDLQNLIETQGTLLNNPCCSYAGM